MMLAFLLALSAIAFMALRIIAVWSVRHQGCDAYFVLLAAEAFREKWRLPISIPPVYMLEKREVWYPPAFLVFCGLFSQKFLNSAYWVLGHLIDLASALLLAVLVLYLDGTIVSAAAAVLAYAMAAGVLREFSSLNVRPFGLLIFNVWVLVGIGLYAGAFPTIPGWLCFGLISVLVFYSHKLSLQQIWFTAPILTFISTSPIWILGLIGIYGLSFLVWPRGWHGILRGHIVIVRFWSKNWRLLGAHMVRQSPIYGDGTTRTDVYADESPRAFARYLVDAIHQNYFVVPFCFAYLTGTLHFSGVEGVLLGWVISVYGAGIAIHCIKRLRGIGLGRQYFKFALLPTLAGTALGVSRGDLGTITIAVIASALVLRQYLLVALAMRREEALSIGRQSDDLDEMFEVLSKDTDAKIMFLPAHIADMAAFQLRKPVYWGAHSDVFDERLENFFPVLNYPLSHYAADGVTRLIIDRRYVDAAELGLDSGVAIRQNKTYELYNLTGLQNAS